MQQSICDKHGTPIRVGNRVRVVKTFSRWYMQCATVTEVRHGQLDRWVTIDLPPVLGNLPVIVRDEDVEVVYVETHA